MLLRSLLLLVFQESSKAIGSVLAKPVLKIFDTLFGDLGVSLHGINDEVYLRLKWMELSEDQTIMLIILGTYP